MVGIRFLMSALVAMSFAHVLACGTEGGPSGGGANLPSSAIVPYTKGPATPLLGQSGHDYRRPWVLDQYGELRMWVGDLDVGSGMGSRILSLHSLDGWNWDIENAGIFTAEEDNWEAGRIESPCVLSHDGGFILWYVGGNGDGIGVATSSDGVTWERHPNNPVLVPRDGWETSEDAPSFSSPSVAYLNGSFQIWLLAGHGSGLISAHSPDGMEWSHLGDSAIFTPSKNAEITSLWDHDRLTSATVTVETTPAGRVLYRMWYGAARINAGGQEVGGLGFAGSFDGLEWIRSEDNPVLQDGGYDEGEASPLRLDGRDVLFYTEFWKKEGSNRKVVRLAGHGLSPLLGAD